MRRRACCSCSRALQRLGPLPGAGPLQLPGPVLGLVAWTHGQPAPVAGWRPVRRQAPGLLAAWQSDEAEVWWLEGRFAEVLASARAVVGTTGTGQEQAAGLGLPVVSFAVPPHLGRAFLRNQQRLLGPALRLVEADPRGIACALRDSLEDGRHRRAAARDGPARMGPPGAAARIAADMLRQRAGGGR
jgi:uncharacterized protein (TIGR03492 family)